MKHFYFKPGGTMAKRLAHVQDARFANGAGGSKANDWDDEDDDDATDDGDDDEEDEDDDATDDENTDDEDVAAQERKLLTKIRSSVSGEMAKLKLNKTQRSQIRGIVDGALKSMDLKELKAFTNVETSVRKLADQFERFKTAQEAAKQNVVSAEKRDFLKELITKRMGDIEKLIQSRDENRVITISTRSAERMVQSDVAKQKRDYIHTTDNLISGAGLGDADEIIDSFAVDAFIPKRRPRQFISDIADVTRVSEVPKVKIWEEEGPETGVIAIIAEGQLKPAVGLTVVRNQHEVRKAAGKVIFTEEVAKFKKRIFSILKTLFNDKVYRDYQNILSTDLVAAAAAYPGSALDGQYTAPTDFHAIGAVASVIETLEFFPDTLIINPQDKWRMALSQTADGQFFVALPVMGTNGSISMAGFRVVTTNKIAVGKFILGESGMYKIEEEGVTIRMGYGLSKNETSGEYEFDFDHNRFRIIGEIFFHNYIPTPYAGSFVMGDFAAIKTLLTKP